MRMPVKKGFVKKTKPGDELMSNFLRNKSKYMANPHHCPFCGTDDFNTVEPRMEGGLMVQECCCIVCRNAWNEVYRMVDVVPNGKIP